MTIASRVVRARESTSAPELRELAVDSSPQVRRQVAANAHAPADVVAALVADRDWRTRAAVAARPDVPTPAGETLAEDKAWQVRFALAHNHDSGPVVWRAITQATRTDIRMVFAQQPWVPLDISELLSADAVKDVRENLAIRTTHRTVLDRLLADNHGDVRAAAIRNQLITEHDAVAAASDRQPTVRAAAAHSPALPSSERSRLLADRSHYVREAAQDGPWHLASVEPETPPGAEEAPDLTDPHTMAAWPAAPSKPRTKWLKMFTQYRPNQDEVPPHVVWFWRYSERIDRDPAFIRWWAGTPTEKLYLHIAPFPTRRYEAIAHADGLYIAAGVPDPTALREAKIQELDENDPQLVDLMVDLLMPALENALSQAGQELGLGPAPSLPPNS